MLLPFFNIAALSMIGFLPHQLGLAHAALLLIFLLFALRTKIRSQIDLAWASFGITAFNLIKILWKNWPAPALVTWFLFFTWKFFARGWRPKSSDFRCDWKSALAGVLIAMLSVGIVVSWYFFDGASPETIPFKVPNTGPVALASLILAFSTLNAFSEEYLFRGLAFEAMRESFKGRISRPDLLANILQAVVFGVSHYHGFPYGWKGSALAIVFALLMGLLKMRSRSGLFAPWLAHACTDLGMAIFLASVSH